MTALPTRLRPFVQVMLALVLLAAGTNCVLRLLSDASILTWPPRVMAGTGFLEDNRERVAAALQEYRDQRVGADNYLGVIVGISNVREGVNLKIVHETAGDNWHFLGLGGSGLGMSDVARHADVLLSSALRPDLVMLGIGDHQLVDTNPKPSALRTPFLEYVRRGDVRNTLTSIRDWCWFFARRQDISVATESAVLDARDALFRAARVRVAEEDVRRNSPWREMIKSDWPDHFSKATLREEEKFFEDLGVFDARTYEASPRAASTLADMIERFRSGGATVIVVLMPEHSMLRQRIPHDAHDRLMTRLQASFPGAAPPVIDFRAAIGDDGFVDLAHLNHNGSAQFSRLLAAPIKRYLPTHAALMKAFLTTHDETRSRTSMIQREIP